jgi:hypothetical protein
VLFIYTEESVCRRLVKDGDRTVALLILDHMKQIEEVVLWPDSSSADKLNVLRLAASHVARYQVYRQFGNALLTVTHGLGQTSPERSQHFLEDNTVPDKIAALDEDALTTALKQIGVNVIVAGVETLSDALTTVLTDEKLRGIPLSFTIGEPLGYQNLRTVTFKVEAPKTFRIWHSLSRPHGAHDLYIVPGYHPVMANKESAGLINGDTDAYISGKAVRAVYAPKGSTPELENFLFSSSWTKVNHPFYGIGQEVKTSISETKALSADGIQEIVTLVSAMLELGETYIDVSGGFRGPYEYPGNIARRAGIRTSEWNGAARGSEGVCAWSHQVLEDEGELAAAYVPGWFISEGWLTAYEQAGASLS